MWVKFERAANRVTKIRQLNNNGVGQIYYMCDDYGENKIIKGASYNVYELGYTSIKKYVRKNKFTEVK